MNRTVVRSRSLARDDRGVSLVLALFIVTTISLVVGALLEQAYTNSAATVGLRKQSAAAYAADSAAQYAVNQVRLTSGSLASTDFCGGTGNTTETLTNFYPASTGTPGMTATLVCRPDTTNLGAGGNPQGSNVSPGSALLTLDPNVNHTGIYANVNAGAIKVRGGIFSNSKVVAPGGLVNTWTATPPATGTTYNLVRGTCSGLSISPGPGTQTCSYATADIRGTDPGLLTPHGASYDTPTLPGAAAVIKSCNNVSNCTTGATCSGGNKFQTVSPGTFVGAAGLTALNSLSGCSNSVVWFMPGTYYFNLPSMWNLPSYYLVAGTFSANADITKQPSQWADPTNACIGPGATGSTTSSGVEFVLGGATQIGVNNSAGAGTQAAICASNAASGPPVAIYGLKTGANALNACTPPASGAASCAVLTSGYSPKSTLTINGTTYVPTGVLDIALNNNSKKLFYWGLISWAISFTGSGSASVSNAIVDVPDSAPSPYPAVNAYYLRVFVCTGTSPCSTTGTPKIQGAIRAKSVNPGGVEVLGWSEQR